MAFQTAGPGGPDAQRIWTRHATLRPPPVSIAYYMLSSIVKLETATLRLSAMASRSSGPHEAGHWTAIAQMPGASENCR